jgi:DHA1 family inner membrane transport protein
MAVWGFAFWMAIPAVLRMLTERSLHTSERMGDAQAGMASGRVLGPILGGLALGAGQFARLSVTGAAVVMAAGILIGGVEAYRLRPTIEEVR